MEQRLYCIGNAQRAARAQIAALGAQMIAMAVYEDAQKMADQAEAAAEALNGRFIGPRLGKHTPPTLPFYPPLNPWSGLLHFRGEQVSFEEYMHGYRESLERDIARRKRAQDDDEERLHRDTEINLLHRGLIQEHLEEDERHENEVEEIEERRRRRREQEERDTAAVRDVSMQEYDDDTEGKQESDDDTGDMDR